MRFSLLGSPEQRRDVVGWLMRGALGALFIAMQVGGGAVLIFPGTAPIGAASLGATMVGAIITDAFVLGNPLMVVAPGGLLAAVAIAAFRDPALESTIATLEKRKRSRAST